MKIENLPSSSVVSDFQRRRFILIIGLFILAISNVATGCRSNDPSNQESFGVADLTISAAVSLKDAFNEIAAIEQSRTGTKINFNYGASGALEKQLESGAPADVFASAGAKQMDDLAAKGMVVQGSRNDFARNSLVLVVSASSSGLGNFAALEGATAKKIAVGNPKTVPAGQYTEQMFTKLGLLPKIQPKLIYAEDVRQVLDYVVRGEVDAGIVYSSDALSAGEKVKVVDHAADDSHDPILYPIAIVKDTKQQAAAQKFVDLVLSPEGQAILVKHGFVRVK